VLDQQVDERDALDDVAVAARRDVTDGRRYGFSSRIELSAR
jgi:hypothetical protein